MSVYLQMCMCVVLDMFQCIKITFGKSQRWFVPLPATLLHVCVEPGPCIMANRNEERDLKLEFPLEINHMKCNLLLLFEVWIVLC